MSPQKLKVTAAVLTPFVIAIVAACSGLQPEASIADMPARLEPAASESLGRTEAAIPASRRVGPGDNPATQAPRRTTVKPFDIEVQRVKSMRHDKGVFEIGIDALVMSRPAPRDGDAGTTCLRLPVEHARTLQLLLKQQLAELDKLQPRSRRSGRS